ncbi:MAG: hypothetical protein KatS3mg057_2461 [Herpetosiphonaceae bacterium]|nr:MAG: hypothetical protein KatS3mg057_2461 [Herpetosiphonaceae bacterium]
MQIFFGGEAQELLAGFRFIRIACYDADRDECYIVPLAFALDGVDVMIAVGDGRLAALLAANQARPGLEADSIQPDFSYRTITALAQPSEVTDPAERDKGLDLLQARYGDEWHIWRPPAPRRLFRLHLVDVQARVEEKS